MSKSPFDHAASVSAFTSLKSDSSNRRWEITQNEMLYSFELALG